MKPSKPQARVQATKRSDIDASSPSSKRLKSSSTTYDANSDIFEELGPNEPKDLPTFELPNPFNATKRDRSMFVHNSSSPLKGEVTKVDLSDQDFSSSPLKSDKNVRTLEKGSPIGALESRSLNSSGVDMVEKCSTATVNEEMWHVEPWSSEAADLFDEPFRPRVRNDMARFHSPQESSNGFKHDLVGSPTTRRTSGIIEDDSSQHYTAERSWNIATDGPVYSGPAREPSDTFEDDSVDQEITQGLWISTECHDEEPRAGEATQDETANKVDKERASPLNGDETVEEASQMDEVDAWLMKEYGPYVEFVD